MLKGNLEGEFSFETLVCQLLRTDINSLSNTTPKHSSFIAETFAVFASTDAKNRMDACAMDSLPKDLSVETEARLFHERVHYWQLISTSFQQRRFNYFLESLRIELAERHGRCEMVCGLTPSNITAERFQLAYAIAVSDADFKWADLSPEKVIGFNEIDYKDLTYQIYVHLPSAPNTNNPAYGAALGFNLSQEIAYVPFTGIALLESAAYISQLLFEKKALPRLKDARDKFNIRYLGCWEFWYRLHGQRYQSEEELALAFLAAVDLTMMGDLFLAEEIDHETYFCSELELENGCIPYRFGKLAFRAQGIPPLTCTDGNVAQAVSIFQENCCLKFNWTSPVIVAKKMAVYLTRLLVQGCGWAINWTEIQYPLLKQLLNQPIHKLAENLEMLQPIWTSLWKSDSTLSGQNTVLGRRILGMMLNSSLDRVYHPGEIAVPHKYANSLAKRFPMPFILFDGSYYLDQHIENMEAMVNRPYFINAYGLAAECIQLLSLAPLSHGQLDCGLIDSVTKMPQCLYTNSGLGCPQKRLTEAEINLRKQFQLDDWCHWTFATLQTHVAPKEVQRHWLTKWFGQES